MIQKSLMKNYIEKLGDPHDKSVPFSYNAIDFKLRTLIGKSEIHSEGLCSHKAIIRRELGENYCRQCHKELIIGVLRCNDYLLFRNPHCSSPICSDCIENNPDEFYKKFKESLELYKNQ